MSLTVQLIITFGEIHHYSAQTCVTECSLPLKMAIYLATHFALLAFVWDCT